ncbi:hypothetical protein CHARACLAT_028388, partial [Characodon lateralis]|nr:hypothetical protein [Characodon lateralis]
QHNSYHRQSGHNLQERAPQIQNQDNERACEQWRTDLSVPDRRRSGQRDQCLNECPSAICCGWERGRGESGEQNGEGQTVPLGSGTRAYWSNRLLCPAEVGGVAVFLGVSVGSLGTLL